jgi:hypothetical protein
MRAVKRNGLALPQPGHDVQELRAPLVPGSFTEEVPVGFLLGLLSSGHDVEQQPPAGMPLEGGGHLRGQRR